MRKVHDLSALDWLLAESFPYLWQFQPSATVAASPDLHPIPARVPGSVQRALEIAVGASKGRFPRCGGVSILDFNGDPKPAALALKRLLRREERG